MALIYRADGTFVSSAPTGHSWTWQEIATVVASSYRLYPTEVGVMVAPYRVNIASLPFNEQATRTAYTYIGGDALELSHREYKLLMEGSR